MPSQLYQILRRGGRALCTEYIDSNGVIYTHQTIENEVDGLIDLLALLLQLDETVRHAHLCHSSVKRIFKLPGEEGFCGYRNLQMLLSYLARHYIRNGDRLPGVLDLQDDIERAWDRGFVSKSRIETGGIRGTRKYIGTPEVVAYLNLNGVAHRATAFRQSYYEKQQKQAPNVFDQLLLSVRDYFKSGEVASDPISIDKSDLISKVSKTKLAPLYLQQPGHSVTVIGFVAHEDGSSSLLVFDPGYTPSQDMRELLDFMDFFSSPPRDIYAQLDGDILSNIQHANVTGNARVTALIQGTLSRYLHEKVQKSRQKDGQQQADKAVILQQELISMLLEGYKRDGRHLKRYSEFEVVATC